LSDAEWHCELKGQHQPHHVSLPAKNHAMHDFCFGGGTKAPQVVFPHVVNVHKWGQTKPSENKVENPKTKASHGKRWKILPLLQSPGKLSLMPKAFQE